MTADRRKGRPRVRMMQLAHAAGLPLPAYQTTGSAGVDLIAALPADAPLRLPPRGRALLPTGLVIELPAGYEAQVRPRSGLALRHGVTVLNSPGTIDADYRGEVQVVLVNLGTVPFEIRRGDRIAQLVVAPVVQVAIAAADGVGATARGAGGFGSTGIEAGGRTAAKKKSMPGKGVDAKSTSPLRPRSGRMTTGRS